MPDRNLLLPLAKVVLAAAWADGQISPNEINSVKEIPLRLPSSSGQTGPQLTAREFAMLEMHARAPIGTDERARPLDELQATQWTAADRKLAISAPTNLIQADGTVTADEQSVVAVAGGFVSELELRDIGSIASWLYLPRKAFIDAKLRIPAEQRAE